MDFTFGETDQKRLGSLMDVRLFKGHMTGYITTFIESILKYPLNPSQL